MDKRTVSRIYVDFYGADYDMRMVFQPWTLLVESLLVDLLAV